MPTARCWAPLVILGVWACGGGGDSTGTTITGPLPPTASLPLMGRVIFQSTVDDTLSDVYAAKLDGSDRQRLTGSDGSDFCPVVSPDGNWIAYMNKLIVDGSGVPFSARGPRVMLMKGDGTAKRGFAPFASDANFVECPVWSRDSKSFASIQGPDVYISPSSPSTIRIFAASGDPIAAFTSNAKVSALSFSPDGSTLIYSTRTYGTAGDQNYQVRTASLDGRETVLVAGSDPIWTKDGTRIYYQCGGACGSTSSIPVACQGVCRLTVATGTAVSIMGSAPPLAIAPDGVSIAYTNDNYLFFRGSGIAHGATPDRPVWNQDGTLIGYICNPPLDHRDVCIEPVTGGPPNNLTNGSGVNSSISFSPP